MYNTDPDKQFRRELREQWRQNLRFKSRRFLTDLTERRPSVEYLTPGMTKSIPYPDWHQKGQMTWTAMAAIDKVNSFTPTVMNLHGGADPSLETALQKKYKLSDFIPKETMNGKYQYEPLNEHEIPQFATEGRRCFLRIDNSYQIKFYLVKNNNSAFIVLKDPAHYDLIKCMYPTILNELF